MNSRTEWRQRPYVHRLHLADRDLDLLADDLGDTEDVRDEDVVVRQPVVDGRIADAELFLSKLNRFVGVLWFLFVKQPFRAII